MYYIKIGITYLKASMFQDKSYSDLRWNRNTAGTLYAIIPFPYAIPGLFFYSLPKDKFLLILEREDVGGREKHGSVASCTRPQPSYVPWPGIKPATFWYLQWYSNQLSHPARVTPGLLLKAIQHEKDSQNKHSQMDGEQRVKCTAQWSTQSYNLASQAKLHKESAGPEF